jgi:enoyl-CoA hydratase/carnithine racemase
MILCEPIFRAGDVGMRLWTTEITDGVCIATYSFPPMNYIGIDGTREMVALIEEWKHPEVRAIVINGGVKDKFITHYYGEELATIGPDVIENCRALGITPIPEYGEMLRRLQKLPKPIVVAMNGDAMGGGFEFCLACDIRIGEKGDYRYGLPETKLGLIPGGGGTQRLPRLIGLGRAMEFILRGRVVSPKAALELGIISELADNATVRATEIAGELAAMPTVGVARSKRVIYEGSEVFLDGGLDMENSAFLDVMLSEDAHRAVGHYLGLPLEERRTWLENPKQPKYKGR